MNVSTGFDPDSKKITVTVNTNLLKKYHVNFKGLFQMAPRKPKGLEVNIRSGNLATVSFPVPEENIKVLGEGRGMVGIDRDDMDGIMEIINKFTNSAIRKELKQTEFIPLEGYEEDLLKEDIKTAVQNKRNLCIIDTYESYLKNEEDRKYEYNQYRVDYGTNEYSDVAILIATGKLSEVRKLYKKKLKKETWV